MKGSQTAGFEAYSGIEDLYRKKWVWDKVAWGTHCVDCYPGNCPYRVYVKDGTVLWEEPAGTFQTVEEGVPDNNPMGCQKGASWSRQLYSPDRLLHPLKRVGERGEGRWRQISWDEALTEIADGLIDAICEDGPESILQEGTPEIGGAIFSHRFLGLIGGVATDLNGSINDFASGLYQTFGKFNPSAELGDWFHSELLIIWHNNPAYSAIPSFHFTSEARYHGAEIYSISPDYNPSAIHADTFLAVRPGTDAALALGACQTIIEEDLLDHRFVKEQTDLPLLVRTGNGHFLRGIDIDPGQGEEQFYWWDARKSELAAAGRSDLRLEEADPALEGTYRVELAGGERVEVAPVLELLKRRLDQRYRPEQAAEICGVHAEGIRSLARKVAKMRTKIPLGANSMKSYHGDLMERSIVLLLGLTGNWGKHGTGPRCWSIGQLDGLELALFKTHPGLEGAQQMLMSAYGAYADLRKQDPTVTDEMLAIEFEKQFFRKGADVSELWMNFLPPAFLWYYHCGYREVWNRREWSDPAMCRPFDDYVQEAVEGGWWGILPELAERATPRVLIECGGNILRRTRGGCTQLLEHLWPKLKMIVTVDWRLSMTALHSDIVLPAANHYEKIGFHIPTPHMMNATFSDKAVEPAGEAKSEWEIFRLLSKKVSERARQRGSNEYRTWRGDKRNLEDLGDAFTLGGALDDEETVWDDVLRDTTLAGTLPQGTSLETMREHGYMRFIGWGFTAMAQAQASDIHHDEVHIPFRRHTEQKQPYPTLTRRAQFFIDHPWFIEADEALPRHKEPPKMGGNYPLHLTSGHNRHSIHAMNQVNPVLLETHRGQPFCFLSTTDATARGIADDGEVRVFNDFGSYRTAVKVSASVRPGQIIFYNGWEPYMHAGWRGGNEVEPGMVKWLHFASGYGHLDYWPMQWQPVPFDRGVYVEVERLDPDLDRREPSSFGTTGGL